MLHTVLHVDHVRENLVIVLLTNHIVHEQVLLASVKSYVCICMYVCTRCARFMNFTNISTRIAQMLREHTLLTSHHEVFTCVSPPLFLTSTVQCIHNTHFV